MSPARDPLATPMWDAVDAVQFIDTNHVAWRVVETDTTGVPGATGSHCLVFLCAGLARRVWKYPADWRTLSPLELELLATTL